MPTHDAVDADALERAIERCFDRADDSAVPAPRQEQFRTAARRLRAQLVKLESKRFRAGTAEVAAANGAVAQANVALEEDLSKLQALAKAVEAVQAAIAKLDQVVVLAAKVV